MLRVSGHCTNNYWDCLDLQIYVGLDTINIAIMLHGHGSTVQTQITITWELSWGEERHKTGRKRCFNLANIGLWYRPVIIGGIGDIKTSISSSWVSTWNMIQQPSALTFLKYWKLGFVWNITGTEKNISDSTIQGVNHNQCETVFILSFQRKICKIYVRIIYKIWEA